MNTNIARFTGCIPLLCLPFASLTVTSPSRAATITVTNTADSGAGTLRAALASGNNGDTIDFALPNPAKITLTSGELLVSKSVNILGPGASKLAIDGNGSNRVFHFSSTLTNLIADLTVTNGSTRFYSSPTNGGGGILNYQAILTVSNCAIVGNLAYHYFGGGILNNNGALLVINSTFNGNNASNSEGGAIHEYGGTVKIINSTVSGNLGTAIVADGEMQILNCTISDNNFGYNIRSIGNVGIGGSILKAGDVVLASIYAEFGGTVTSLGYNLCSDGGGGYLTNATDQINTDPLLGPLQDNGGPTFTHAPLPGSPAIDKGINFSVSATDQRGLPRTFDKPAIANVAGGDGTDIGAVESQSFTVVNTNDSGVGSLRQAIADSNAYPGTNTIDFAPSAYGTILLTSGELIVSESVNILGPGANNLAVDGNAASRVLIIAESNAVTISDLTITNGLGGIVCGGNQAATTVNNCMVVGNLGFGGIGTRRTFFGPAGVQIVNSTLIGNTAHRGGGIDNAGTAVTVLNCTLSENVADYGGGIFNDNFGSVTIHNCTLSGNSSQVLGGGIYSQSTATAPLRIGSTVFREGVSGANISTFLGLVPISEGYNLCSDNGGGVLTNATDQINTDPMLGPLQDNGGPTFTHAPLPGSPAIDAGKNLSGSTSDQRGFTRTLNLAGYPNAAGGDGTDIGAFESQDASLRLINIGVVSNQFGFRLIGPFTNVVVEASINVSGSNWTALTTNTLTDAALRFNDPSAPTLPKRFYRARVQ